MVVAARVWAGPERLVLVKRSQEKTDLSFLTEKPEGTVIIHGIPANRMQAAIVHGQDIASRTSHSYWSGLRPRFREGLPATTIVDVNATLSLTNKPQAERVLEAIRSIDPKKLVVLLGEIMGERLIYTDKSSMSIKEIPSGPGIPKIMILGCNSHAGAAPSPASLIIATGRKISYGEAIGLTNEFSQSIDGKKSWRELLKGFQNTHADFLIGTIAKTIIIETTANIG
jgi:hypothetical protein